MTATLAPSAKAIISSFLDQLGLGSLGAWAFNEYVKLGGGDSAIQAIQLELPNQPAFTARFPAIAAMRKAGIQPVTVAQYVNYEQSLSQSLKAAGLPPAFWSSHAPHSTFNDMVTKLLSNNVSVVEANDRVQQGVAYMRQAPPEVRQAFGDIYGPHGDGALTALFLDPTYTLPTLQKMQRTAYTVGEGAVQGVGGISAAAAGQVAQLGLSDDQTRQQLAALGQSGVLSGRVGEQLTADQVVRGGFNTDAMSTQQLEQIVAQRKASAAGLTGQSFRPGTDTGVGSQGVAPS